MKYATSNRDLLKRHKIDIEVIYQTEMSFDAPFDTVEQIKRNAMKEYQKGGFDRNLVDFGYISGSPVSYPYFTIKGKDRAEVSDLTCCFIRFLTKYNVKFNP